ncbi:sensor histidine kinase [Idiomarina tyrosinivorans]|nr:HAMP domain-containing sensor histidine kinase [Idiomarina tyrosinivorans]
MKNSLSMLLQLIERLTEQVNQPDVANDLAHLHYETQRINMGLIQLLALYRHDADSLPLAMEENFADELIEDVLAQNEVYIQQRQLTVTTDIEPDLAAYFDRDLIYTLVNDIVVNAMRYAADKLHIVAKKADKGLTIEIHDDGPGYPENMLQSSIQPLGELDLTAARTGLGLFFAQLIASVHQRDDVSGKILLENNGCFGGSLFRLTLP